MKRNTALRLAIEALVYIRRQRYAYMAHQEGSYPEVLTAKWQYAKYTEAIAILTELVEYDDKNNDIGK